MENRRKERSTVANFEERFYGDQSYRKEERREGRSKVRRTDSRRTPNSEEKRPSLRRSLSDKKISGEQLKSGSYSTTERRHRRWQEEAWDNTTDRRRWGWAGGEAMQGYGHHQHLQDYGEMSSMDTSEDRPAMVYQQQSYNHLYTQHKRSVSRSRSIRRPSPQRAKSVGPTPSQQMTYPSRTQSFSSLYDKENRSRGTSLDLRPLQNCISSTRLYYQDQEYENMKADHDNYGYVPRALQNIQINEEEIRRSRRQSSRSLLDLSNVTINDSEIDKVSVAHSIDMNMIDEEYDTSNN